MSWSRLSERYSLTITPNNASQEELTSVGFKLHEKSETEYILEIDGYQFEENIEGKIRFKMKDTYRSILGMRLLQERFLQNLENDIRDSEGMRINMEETQSDFSFNYDQFNGQASIENMSNQISKLTGNPVAQTAIFMVSLNPLMFAFSANVLQRFVYFRALKPMMPNNLTGFFKILGSSWGV